MQGAKDADCGENGAFRRQCGEEIHPYTDGVSAPPTASSSQGRGAAAQPGRSRRRDCWQRPACIMARRAVATARERLLPPLAGSNPPDEAWRGGRFKIDDRIQ